MPRILIADDNSNIQKMVTLALHGAGIDVVSVSNGGAAIRSLPESLPDLVLADVFMPVRNGYEVCEFIKHDTRFSHVPVVLLVGAFDPLDETEAQRVSADGILKKPFIPPDPLISLVKALLSKAFNERPEPVPVAVGVHAAQEAAPQEAGHAGEVPAAAAAISEPVADEFVPGAIEADFGSHEETLAFGSLLEMPAPAETSAGPPIKEENPDALRGPAEHDSLIAEIPELDDVVPPDSMNRASHAAVADQFSGASGANGVFGGNDSESAADLDAELGFQITPDLGEELEAALEAEDTEEFETHTEFHPDVSSAASFDPVGDTETDVLAEPAVAEPTATEPTHWENVESPANSEQAANAEPPAMDNSEGVLEETLASEDLAEGSEPGYAEVAADLIEFEPAESQPPGPEGIHEASSGGGSGDLAGWPPPSWGQSVPESSPASVAPPVPVFPGSDKLWAAAPPAPSEAAQASAEEAKEETAVPVNAEAAQETETVAPLAGDYGAADYGLAEIVLPAPDDVSLAEEPPNEPGIARHPAEMLPAERLAEMAAASVTSDAGLEQHYAAQPAARSAPDPELIEAVVTRIVDRMQPAVMDLVTREILRPLVEALVRREINRSS